MLGVRQESKPQEGQEASQSSEAAESHRWMLYDPTAGLVMLQVSTVLWRLDWKNHVER